LRESQACKRKNGGVGIGYAPKPGESRTQIVVWEIDDPSKRDDPRYWWAAEEVERLKGLSDELPDLTGRPKGQSLASLRQQAEGDEVELVHPIVRSGADHDVRRVRIPLTQWRDADPERTYLIVTHLRPPTDEEQDKRKAEGMPWPDEVEALRQEWLAAEAAGQGERATDARARLDAELAGLGFLKPRRISAWEPSRAVELRPGVFVQDERPSAPSLK
jgi:hypothetical protein